MVAPRKFRNTEERAAIRAEVMEKLEQLHITELEELKVQDVLDKFVALDHGGTLQGTIELNSINSVLEYVLPGRRIIHHMMRIRHGTRDEALDNTGPHNT